MVVYGEDAPGEQLYLVFRAVLMSDLSFLDLQEVSLLS